jgi:hypothetical protein
MEDARQSCSGNKSGVNSMDLEQLWCQLDGGRTPELFPEQLWCRLDRGHTPELFPEQVERQLYAETTPDLFPEQVECQLEDAPQTCSGNKSSSA